MVEKMNQTLAKTISMYINSTHKDWDTFLSFALFSFRTSVHESTGETPFFLLYGRDCRLPVESALNQVPSRYIVDISDYKVEVVQNLSFAWSQAREHIQAAQSKQKRAYDRSASKNVSFRIGERVWIFVPAVTPGRTKKFTRRWRGPYRILATNLPIVQVKPCEKPDSQAFWVHVNCLKPFFEPDDNLLSLEGVLGEAKKSGKAAAPTERPIENSKPKQGILKVKSAEQEWLTKYNLRPRK